MNETLFIIGNGFDLNHGLPTAYKNFRDNYAKSRPALWRVLERLYGEKLNMELWWSEFEANLGRVDFQHLQNSRNGDALGAIITKDFFRFHLSFFFGEWIKGVNQTITTEMLKRDDVNSEALFFTFNYTTLLEKLYRVNDNNVLHIHKSVKDLPQNERCLIVGHDSDYKQLIECAEQFSLLGISPQYIDEVNREVQLGAKNVKGNIERHSEDFEKYSDIKHYIIMGFSLNDIDKPYMEKIIEVNHNIDNADWTIYYHEEGDDVIFRNKLMSLGIKDANINEPIHW